MELKRNVILPDTSRGYGYERPGGGGGKKNPERDRQAHATKLLRELKEAAKADFAAKERGGTYLRFNSSAGYELDPDSFDNATSRVQLVNVRSTGGDKPVVSATVYVPQRKAGFFEKKVSEYADKDLATKKGNPKNQPLVESIDSVETATVRSLWTGRDDEYPTDAARWCEVWFGTRYGNAEELFGSFKMWCRDRQVDASDDYLVFPECLVVLAKLDANGLNDLFDGIAPMSEVRPLAEPNHEFLDFESRFQRELSDDAASRVVQTDSGTSVCILDTGLNARHPLLEPAIHNADDSILAAEGGWSSNDSDGHGTEMAGVALYDGLRGALESSDPIQLHASLESVKILPETNDNPRHLYGSITNDAMMSIEIEHPERSRVYCMAVTDDADRDDGTPSSWSAKLDELAAGTDSDGDYKRLCLVSAGNVDKNGFHGTAYSDHNVNSPVQDPA